MNESVSSVLILFLTKDFIFSFNKNTQTTDNLRAGVVMMLVLVWLVIISIVQDYTWVLLGVPEATHVEGTTKKKDEVEQTESKGSNKDEKAASEEEEDKEDERSTAIEVTAVADGDDI